MATRKTVWVADDGSHHSTEDDASAWDTYCRLRDVIQAADLDWRDGVGADAATPDKIAEIVLKNFDLTAKPSDWAATRRA